MILSKSAFLFLFFAALPLLSQVSGQNLKMPLSLGVYGNLNMNMHSSNFDYITTLNPSTIFFKQNKNYFSGSAGAILNIPISDIFVLSGRIGYNGLGGKLDGNDLLITGVNNNYEMDATISYLEITPAVQLHNLLPVKPLYFLAGLEFGIPLGPKYTITRENLTTTIESDLKLPDANTRIALALGLGYVFNLSDKVFLSPEFSVRIPFNKVSSYNYLNSWDVPQLRLGVALTFSLASDNKNKSESETKSYLNIGQVSVSYLGSDGKRHSADRVRLEDVQYTELYPVIPYVFFAENQTVPDKRGLILTPEAKAGEFDEKMIDPNALTINNHLLDIIGSRMKATPNAELTITGTLDGKKETMASHISQQRADWAKNYLVERWKIDPERINVKAIGLPEKPSTSNVSEGLEENRRDEFASSNQAILAPVFLNKESKRIADPGLLEFTSDVETSDSITNWTLEISQAGKDLRLYQGTGSIKPISWNISPNELDSKQIPIDYVFTVNNVSGKKETSKGQIPVDYYSFTRKKTQDMPDKLVSKYSLIQFDFDKYDISQNDMEVINKYIIPDVKYNSTVKIYGYTDRIGTEEYNRTLAGNRANAVMTILKGKVNTAKYEVYAIGKDFEVFDNDLPIGRQLSRTVQITIETPK